MLKSSLTLIITCGDVEGGWQVQSCLPHPTQVCGKVVSVVLGFRLLCYYRMHTVLFNLKSTTCYCDLQCTCTSSSFKLTLQL